MLNTQQVGDLIERLVDARVDNDRPALVDLLHDLIQGSRGDSLNVVLVLAGVVAADVAEVDDPDGFHQMSVRHIDASGNETPGSARDLPAHVATFAQMVIAVANGDRAMAKDLFIGYCGEGEESGRRALALIIFALNEAVHLNSECRYCSANEAV